MPKYAQFDANAPAPYPVIGWYDADAIEYPTLPPETVLYTMSDDEWAAHMDNTNQNYAYDGTSLVTYTPTPPPPTADQVYGQKITSGIAVTSTGTPAINATYPIDTASYAALGSIARDASSGLGLPNDLPTMPVKDSDGNPHDFNETDVIALYKAERNLLSALGAQRDVMAQGGIPVWPPQTATIP